MFCHTNGIKFSDLSVLKAKIYGFKLVYLFGTPDRISHPCNLIGPLNIFQACDDCDQFGNANGTSPLLRLS